MISKKQAMLNPPSEVILDVSLPQDIETYKQLQKYFWRKLHIDIDVNPESDYFEHLFYNQDLRSFMGIMLEFPSVFVIFPKYYRDDNPNTMWSKMWRQLVRQSEILDEWWKKMTEELSESLHKAITELDKALTEPLNLKVYAHIQKAKARLVEIAEYYKV